MDTAVFFKNANSQKMILVPRFPTSGKDGEALNHELKRQVGWTSHPFQQ